MASSEAHGDVEMVGLTSAEFTIGRKFIAFTIGGGNYERHTCVDLLVDDKVVRMPATGWRSDRLTPACWDVADLAGRAARQDPARRPRQRRLGAHQRRPDLADRLAPIAPLTSVAPALSRVAAAPIPFHGPTVDHGRLNPRSDRRAGSTTSRAHLLRRRVPPVRPAMVQMLDSCGQPRLVRWTELEPAFWAAKLDEPVSRNSVIDYDKPGLSPTTEAAVTAFGSRQPKPVPLLQPRPRPKVDQIRE